MDVRFPNGTVVTNVPDGITKAELIAKLTANGYDMAKLTTAVAASTEEAPERPGFTGAFMDAVSTLGLTDEAAAFSANPTAENRAALLEAAKSKYGEGVGGFGKGENWEYFKELLGGSLGQIVAPALSATAAAAAGSLASPLVGAGAGVAAGFTAGTSQYTIQNLVRQAQEQQKAVEEGRAPPETSTLKAIGAAVPQAALDVAGEQLLSPFFKAFPFVRNLVFPETKKAASEAAKAVEQSVLARVGKGAATGVAVEVPQEIMQQGLERWQAGLSLTDDDAMEEYKQAAIGAAVLGAPLGGIGGAVSPYASKKETPAASGETFGEPTTPAAAPPGAPPAAVATAPEDDTSAITALSSDPMAVEDYKRYRRFDSVENSYAAALRDIEARSGSKGAPSGLEQTGLGETGGAGVEGREPSVPPAGGESVTGGPAETAAGAGRERLGSSYEPAQPAGDRKNAVQGTLSTTLEDTGLLDQERQWEAEQQREANTFDGEPLPPITPVAPVSPTIELDPKTPRKERTARAIEAVKAVVDTHEDFAGLAIDDKTVNKAAQRLVNNNGGDPYVSLSRVLEGEPAIPNKAKPKAAEALPFEPVAAFTPEPAATAPTVTPAVEPERRAVKGPEEAVVPTPEPAPSVAPDLFSTDINPEAVPYVRAEPAKEAVPPEMVAFPKTPERAPAPYIEPTPTLEPAKKTKKDKGRVYTVEPAKTNSYPQVMIMARTALRDGYITPAEFGIIEKQSKNKAVPPPNLGGAVKAYIKAGLERKGLGQRGVTAETAAAMGDRTYRQLQRTEGTEAVEGMFSPMERLIRVALDANNQLKTLHHEAIHAIRDMGLFKGSEWALLSDKAKNEWVAKYKIEEKYAGDNLTEEQKIEEAVAEAFADYMANRNQGGKIKHLFDKLRRFLEALVGAARSSAEGVFKDVARGKVGARERTQAAVKGEAAPAQTMGMQYTPERDAERRRVGTELRKNLDALGLKDVALKVPDAMQAARGDTSTRMQRPEAEAAATTGKGIQKLQQGLNAYGFDGAAKGHAPEAYQESLNTAASKVGEAKTKVLSKILPTSSIINIVKSINQQVGLKLESIIDRANAAADAEANIKAGLYELAQPVVKFVSEHGYRELAAAQALARLNKTDILAFDDLKSALAGDEVLKGYATLINNAVTPSEKTEYEAGRARREQDVTEAYKAKDDLARLPGGLEAYKTLRQFYRDAYNLRRAAMDRLFDLMAGGDPAARAKMEAARRDAFEKIRTAPDMNYNGINRTLVPEEYSPFMRFGDYWLRVEKGVNGEPEYYHFENATDRQRFLNRRAAELGQDSNDPDMFKTGILATDKGRSEFASSDSALRQVFNIIDKNNRLSDDQKQALKDDAFQARLDALPEADLRKHFKHAKERTGWAPDPLRVFASYSTKFASNLARMQHMHAYNMAVSEARSMLNELGPSPETSKLQEYADAVIRQGDTSFAPPNTNALVTFMNRMAFLYFLSGGASAMAQFISVPVRVVPSIGATYGYPTAMRLMGKYMKSVWQGKALTEKLPDGSTKWDYPGVNKAPFVKNNPRLADAFKRMEEHRAYSLSPTAVITDTGKTPESALDDVDHKVKSAVLKIGTVLFTAAETLSRQMAAMMRYEAAYDARVAKGIPTAQAHKEAIAEAVKETENALGNYRETERPEIMKGPVGRMVFQFKMYPVNTTKFFLENAHRMLKGQDKEVRRLAMRELAGVLAIGGMFSGVTGMFGYGVVSSAIGLILSQLEDDEDKKRRRETLPVLADDYDAYFRYKWLPEHFGPVAAKVIEVGPVSALSPLNLASRASFNDLWLREGMAGSNWLESAKNLMLANIGPAVSMGSSLDLAAKDFNDGEVMRGVERLMPALVRGPLMAARLATEGAETRGGDKIVDKEHLSDFSIAAAVLGLNPREVEDAQKKRIKALSFQARLSKDKSEALRAMNKAMAEMDYEGVERAGKLVSRFNSSYPEQYAITDETLDSSFNQYMKIRESKLNGVPVGPDETEYYEFLISQP